VKTKTKDGIDNIFSRRVIFTAYPNVDDDNKDGDFGGDLLWIYLKDVEIFLTDSIDFKFS
jgi:hypothetical protein